MTRSSVRIGFVAAASNLLLWGVAPSAWAGSPIPAYIDYGPLAPTSVPTLGQWALLLLALLLGVIAYRTLRGRTNGRLLTPLLLGGALVAWAVAGGGGLRSAQADDWREIYLSQAAGGSEPTEYNHTKVLNTSGVAQQIKALRIVREDIYWGVPSSSPPCTVGLVLQPNSFCYLVLIEVNDD